MTQKYIQTASRPIIVEAIKKIVEAIKCNGKPKKQMLIIVDCSIYTNRQLGL